MRRKRKTVAERRQERYEATQHAWEVFRPQLEALQSRAEAQKLLANMPLPDTPSRGFYTNLGWFIDTLSPPGNSTGAEKRLYIELTKKMDKAGELKTGACAAIEKSLLESLQNQVDWW